jgi:hypothetical protein
MPRFWSLLKDSSRAEHAELHPLLDSMLQWLMALEKKNGKKCWRPSPRKKRKPRRPLGVVVHV